MTLDGIDCFEFFKISYFPHNLFFATSILRAIHSIDICTVKIKNMRNMLAVLTNQIADIWHFNDNKLNINLHVRDIYRSVATPQNTFVRLKFLSFKTN